MWFKLSALKNHHLKYLFSLLMLCHILLLGSRVSPIWWKKCLIYGSIYLLWECLLYSIEQIICFTCMVQVCLSWYLTCCYKHGLLFSSVKLLYVLNCNIYSSVKWHYTVLKRFPVTNLLFQTMFASKCSGCFTCNVHCYIKQLKTHSTHE